MHILVGVAAQGPGAPDRVDATCRRLAADANVLARSRPWRTPAVSGPPGLLAALHLEADLPRQAVRNWLWDLEGDGAATQLELLAGRQQGRWRWGVAVEHEDRAWTGPLVEVAPDLRLPGGPTLAEQHAMRPHPGSAPWTGEGLARWRPRTAGPEVPLGRTWESRPEAAVVRRGWRLGQAPPPPGDRAIAP